MRLRPTFIGVCVVAFAASVLAQAPADRLAFDVASIKPNKSGSVIGTLRVQTSGRLMMTNTTPNAIIATAFGTADGPLRGSQMTGGPSWLGTDRFDIEAKPATDLGVIALRAPEMREMLRTLLAVRFQLAVHHETRQQSVFALLLARNNHQLGPQLRAVDVDCLALLAAQRAADASGVSASAPMCSLKGSEGHWLGHGYRIGQLADLLANTIPGVVRDHTGLEGSFDFELSWRPEPATAVSPSAAPAAIDADEPSIFTAVQEQLGLKLESREEPVDVLVIDHIEKPTGD